MGFHYGDPKGNSVCLQDNGILLVTPRGWSTRALSVEEVVAAVAIRDVVDTVRILNKLVAEGVNHVRAVEGSYERNEEGISAALEEAAEYFGITGYCTKLADDSEHTYPQLIPKE